MDKNSRGRVQLYSESLTHFCQDNKLYLDLLKDHVEELEKLKEYDKLLKQSQTENEVYRLSKAADPRNLAVMFAQMGPADKRLFKAAAKSGEYEDLLTSHHHTENPFCYLCTTIEQHKKHMMRTEKRIHGKKRLPYEAPPPFVPPKPPTPKPESKDCLFKVTVKTGTHIEAACSAPVFLSLQGEDDKLRKTRLTKKFGSLGFFFDSSSTEVFHIRGPRIGRLQRMTLTLGTGESEEEEKDVRRHKWLVDSVIVKDYAMALEYHFTIDKWVRHGVSKRSGERRDQVCLAPTTTAKGAAATGAGRGVLVTTHTARKAISGTDYRVYISMLGPSGAKRRHELRQPENAPRIFQPGGKDVFELYVEDFGDLKGIRLELDLENIRPPEKSDKKKILSSDRKAESSKTWNVDQVIVKDIKTGQKWLFTISDWLNEEKPCKEFWTVKDVKERLSSSIYNQKTMYEIVTKTGKQNFAGTDSTIYLSLFDKDDRRCDIELVDKDKSKFEKGKTDTIREEARVIDTPVRLKVSISGKGTAPDWNMDEKIQVTKYLVEDEIVEFLQRLQFTNKMPDGLTQDKGKILFDSPDANGKKKTGKSQSSKAQSKHGKKSSETKKSSANDFADTAMFGAGRARSTRQSAALKNKVTASDDSENSELSDESDSDAGSEKSQDSVKSHDDFDPEHGVVKLPYAVRVTFAPRTKDDAWLKKDKTVELRASEPGKMLFRDLRLRNDNDYFEKEGRKEMMAKRQAKEEEEKKLLREAKYKKTQKQQQEKRKSSASRSGIRSKSRGRADSSDSSDSSASNFKTQKPGSQRRPMSAHPPTSAKKTPLRSGRGRSSSSDSDSSVNKFGKSSKTDPKRTPDKKQQPSQANKFSERLEDKRRPTSSAADEDRRRTASSSKEADRFRDSSLTSSALRSSARSPRAVESERDLPETRRGLDHVDFGQGSRTGLDKERDKLDLDRNKDRSLQDLNRDRDPLDLDRDRGRLNLDKSKDRNRSDLDKDRGLGLDRDRGRLDLDKGKDRSSRDLDKDRGLGLDRDRGRLDFDKGKDRSPKDLDKSRDRLDLDRDRGRLDFDKGKDRNHSDLDKDRGLGLDRDRGRLDFDKGKDRSPRDLDRGRDRLDLDRERGRLDLDKSKDRNRSDLDKDRGLGLDRDRGRLDLDKGNRSPRDLDRGLGRLDQEKSPRGLDKSRGSPLDLDRSRGHLDLDKGRDRSPLDLDKGRGGQDIDRDLERGRPSRDFDLSGGRGRTDLDRSRGRDLDFDRGRSAAPLDKPKIVVTASDGRQADLGPARTAARVKPRSFNLD